MDTLTLALGAALGVAGILLIYRVAARWPAWKAKLAAWFTSQKSALEARAEGKLVDLENRLKAIEAAGVDQIKADIAALKSKVGV
jgi:hypothetical protein